MWAAGSVGGGAAAGERTDPSGGKWMLNHRRCSAEEEGAARSGWCQLLVRERDRRQPPVRWMDGQTQSDGWRRLFGVFLESINEDISLRCIDFCHADATVFLWVASRMKFFEAHSQGCLAWNASLADLLNITANSSSWLITGYILLREKQGDLKVSPVITQEVWNNLWPFELILSFIQWLIFTLCLQNKKRRAGTAVNKADQTGEKHIYWVDFTLLHIKIKDAH